MFKKITKISITTLLSCLYFSLLFAVEKTEEEVYFSCLPQEVTMEVLYHLDVKSLGRVSQVNKGVHRITQDEHLWKVLSEKENLSEKAEQDLWKNHFKRSTETMVVRLNAFLRKSFSEGSDMRLEAHFNKQKYSIPISKGKYGKILIADNIVLKRCDFLKGQPVYYSVAMAGEQVNIILHNYLPKNQMIGVVEEKIFDPDYSDDGKPIKYVSIRLNFNSIYKGRVHYGWDYIKKK